MDGKVVDEQGVLKEHTQGVSNFYIGKTNYGSALFYIDDFYLYDRALRTNEVSEVMDGKLLPVEPNDKLTTTWGQMKTRRD